MDRRLTAYVLKYLLEHRFESKAEMARQLGMRQRTIEKVFANLDVAKAGNIAMSINQKILDGTSSIYSRPCYGYRKSEDGSLLIVPEEAETVRLIFNLYLSGYSIIGIIHELESRSISSPTGKAKWCRRAIDTLLSNEKYRGGSTATTVLMSDAPQSKQRARYLFSDHHEAIIDEKTFIAVAKEKQRRCNIEVDENGVHRKKTRYTAKIRVSGSLKEE